MIAIPAESSTASIPIGRCGENNARQIVFDLTDYIGTYGPGTAQLLHQRKGDEIPYIPEQVVQSGDKLTWTISSDDTAMPGIGRAELRWYAGDTLAKSVIYATVTLRAIGSQGPDKSAVEILIDSAGEAVNRATSAADRAEAEADRAEISADRAEQAATQAGYMFFEVDQRGHLIYNRTDNVTADFSIVGGRLIYYGD